MSHSYFYSIGPFISAEEGGGRLWRAPNDVVGLIDLAKSSDFGSDPTSGRNVAFFASTAPLGMAYTPLNPGSPGDLRDINVTSGMRDAWESAMGFRPNGAKLVDLLADHLTTGADPAGDDQCYPLNPTISGELEIHLGGHSRVYARRMTMSDAHWPKFVDQKKRELIDVRRDSIAGKIVNPVTKRVDSEYHRQVADALMDKLRRIGLDDFEAIRPKGWGKEEKPVRHNTTIADDFNGSDSDTMGVQLAWTEVVGDWDILSNQAISNNSPLNSNHSARTTSALSSADHYSQANILTITAGSSFCRAGTAFRFAASTNTFYSVANREGFGAVLIWKVVAGTDTELNSTSTAVSLPDVFRGEASGSSITSKLNGGLVASITDTAITSNLYTGLFKRNSSVTCTATFDDFEAGDLAVESGYKNLLLLGVG